MARSASDHDWMYDAVLRQLRDVIVPRTGDPLAAARGKGIARLIKYLAQVDLYGGAYREQELEDLAGLTGNRPASVEEGRRAAAAAVAAGSVSDEDYLRCCGAGWPGIPSWPGRRWVSWPTGTGPTCAEPSEGER